MASAPPPLLDAIRDALAGVPVARAEARWSAAPPAPWHAWLLVVLGRQVARQRWLMSVRRGPLGAVDGDAGAVPRMPGWRYEFHGRGLCLSAPDGEVLDVDDHGDGGLTIDPYFFAARLRSLRDPALPERRARAHYPTDDVVAAAVEELAAAGLLNLGRHGHVFRVAPELEAAADALSAVDFSTRAAQERWAEHLGDHELGADARGAAPGDARGAAQRAAYTRYLFAGLLRRPAAFIEPLEAVLAPAAFVAACAQVIDGPVGAPAGRALERLEAHPDYPPCPAVPRLLERADPARHHPYAVCGAARYLLRRGLHAELAERALLAFARVEVVPGYGGNPLLGDLALALLEHAPAHALAALRRGLRSSTPVAQQKVATALALLDQPWCHRELGRALDETATFEQSAAVRVALLHSSAPDARGAVERWAAVHVMKVAAGPGYTWEEVLEANADGYFASEAEELRPWVEAVRAGIDPDFDGVVWG